MKLLQKKSHAIGSTIFSNMCRDTKDIIDKKSKINNKRSYKSVITKSNK